MFLSNKMTSYLVKSDVLKRVVAFRSVRNHFIEIYPTSSLFHIKLKRGRCFMLCYISNRKNIIKWLSFSLFPLSLFFQPTYCSNNCWFVLVLIKHEIFDTQWTTSKYQLCLIVPHAVGLLSIVHIIGEK